MQPVEAHTWSRVPGYSSDDSDSEGEEDYLASVDERLNEVVAALGSNWTNRPTIKFVPAWCPSKEHAHWPTSSLPPATKRWGHNPPPTFRIEGTVATVVRETLLSNGLFPTRDRDFIIQWSGPGMRDCVYEALNEFQHVNHFPGSSELTRKDRLWTHFHSMTRTFGSDTFDFVPKTYVLPGDVDAFLLAYERTDHLWIVKPAASSRGRGIFLLRDLGELPTEEGVVVSRYVDKPLLIQGLKFDLRIYVLVTCFEPLRAYVYREGLTRFASKPYCTKPEHMDDLFRHLTNYSINKSAKNFVENQELGADNVGHKWSLSALNKHLKCTGVNVKLMWARIMDLLVKSLLSVKPAINARTQALTLDRENCFEIYGFDVLVDEDLKPWLLEVNLSPSMSAESPLDWQVKSSLLADSLTLVGLANIDRQTASLARMRAQRTQLLQLQRSAPVAVGRRSASAGPAPKPGGQRPNTPSGRKGAGSARGAAPRRGEEGDDSPVGASGLLEGAVVLDALDEEQLQMLARSLQESRRCRNFVRLYPTRTTVRRYVPMFRTPECKGQVHVAASQLLATVLFGQKPLRLHCHSMPLLGPGHLDSLSPRRAVGGSRDVADEYEDKQEPAPAPEEVPAPRREQSGLSPRRRKHASRSTSPQLLSPYKVTMPAARMQQSRSTPSLPYLSQNTPGAQHQQPSKNAVRLDAALSAKMQEPRSLASAELFAAKSAEYGVAKPPPLAAKPPPMPRKTERVRVHLAVYNRDIEL